jgi:hypothetical protein
VSLRRALVPLGSLGVFVVIALAGCNTILGNEEGTARVDAGLPSEASVPTGDGGIVQQQSCDTSQGNKVCFGLCVKIDQTNTGCGGPSCDACDPKNVVASECKGGAATLGCGYTSCKPGFESCDGQPANGCEASLNAKETCGSCISRCENLTPFCASNGAGGFSCVTACPLDTKECNGACVDTTTSIDNCGGCGIKCSRPSAVAECVGASCKYACVPGTHECNGTCAQDEDPKACGPTCTVCESGPNTVRSCVLGACSAKCEAGWLDCDRDPLNGCELKADMCPFVDCGFCSGTQKCCNGACTPLGQPCIGPPRRF